MNLCALLILLVTAFDDSFRNGLIALQKGDLVAAQTILEAANRADPRDGRIWVALCQTYWRLHKNEQAEAAADKAFSLAPDNAVVRQSLLIYYNETQQSLKAARIAPKEHAAELYFEAAQPLLEQAKFAEAAAILEEAAPKNAQLELALGVAYYGLRRFDNAADAFLRTIDLAPETEQPYTFLGRIIDQIPSRLPQATKRFEEYEKAHPDSAAGYLLHAKALNAQSLDPEIALRLLDKAIELNNGDASAHFERGTVLDRLKRFGDAASEFERAAVITPDDPAPHYRLARDYERLGKSEAARAEREKHAKLVKARDTME